MSTRPAIPQGAPPRYMLFARVRRSLRPVVMTMAACAAIWSLLWGASSFYEIQENNDDGFGELLPYSVALGIVFIVAGLIEIFGVFAATKQQTRLVRLYCWGSILASVLALGAEVIIIVVQFVFKKKYYDTCFAANNGATVFVPRGWWGETRTLTAEGAKDFCNELIRRRIAVDFVWLAVTAILAALFVSVNFSYYRQLLDPSFSRAPSDQVRMQAFNVYPQYSYPQQPAYPGYQGGFGANNEPALPVYEGSKLPDYDGNGRQSPEKIDDMTGYAPPAGPPPQQAFAPPPGPPPAPAAPKPTNPFERRAEEP